MQLNLIDIGGDDGRLGVIAEACRCEPAPMPREAGLDGFSGAGIVALLQKLPAAVGGDYLEVGVFRGMSILNTAYANPGAMCFGIDNFSQLDPRHDNRDAVLCGAEALGLSNVRLIDADFEDGLRSFTGKVGTFFIDGPHDYRSQLVCLGHAPRLLLDGGVVVVDDANYPHVRQATADFLMMFPDFKLVFEAYTDCHPANMDARQRDCARQGFWNGVHVIAHDPDDAFERIIPPTSGNLDFIRDHGIHHHSLGRAAFECIDVLASIARPWRMPAAIRNLSRALRQGDRAPYLQCNTDSANLGRRLASTKGLHSVA